MRRKKLGLNEHIISALIMFIRLSLLFYFVTETLHGSVIKAYAGLKEKILDMSVKGNDEKLFLLTGELEEAVNGLQRGHSLDSLPDRELGVHKIHLDKVRDIAGRLRSWPDGNLVAVGQAMIDLADDHYATVEANPHHYILTFSSIGYDASSLPLFKNGTSYSKVR